MKKNTICLEAARERNRLKIGVCRPDEVIWHYEELPAPMGQIDARCVSLAEALNNASRKGFGGSREFEGLRSEGRMLCDELLTRDLKEKLRNADAEYLILKLDDRLVHIPWELICIDHEFLCQRFNMGRLVSTRQKIGENTPRSLKKPLNIWILANPGGDLAVAASEGLRIFQDMARMNEDEDVVSPSLDAEITPDEIRVRMTNYDMVHFAGHADYKTRQDPNGLGQSGWRLAGGDFTVHDIDKMAGSAAMPAFVFSNACQSARTEEWEWKGTAGEGSFGLANAFLRAGVKHYLGTFWEIMDEPGGQFAHEFYDLLSTGMPVGKAVREARRNLMEKHGPDTCWASYILYGDPRVSYFGGNETLGKTETPLEPSITRTRATRGTFFNYSLNTAKLKEVWHWTAAILVIITLTVGILAGVYHMKGGEQHRQIEIRRILMAQAEKRQKKTEALFGELIRTAPLSYPSTDGGPLTLAMIFDSRASLSDRKKENLAAFAIQSQLIAHSRFKVLERKSFDVVLQELIWEGPAELNLLMPKLLLFLEVHEDEEGSLLLMRLVDKTTGVVIDNLFETLADDMPVFAQKTQLADDLLKILAAHYPLIGEISEINGEEIRLNVGDDAGVKMGQWFKVVGKSVFLKVVSVEMETCVVKIAKGRSSRLEKGCRVEAISL